MSVCHPHRCVTTHAAMQYTARMVWMDAGQYCVACDIEVASCLCMHIYAVVTTSADDVRTRLERDTGNSIIHD